MNTKTMRLPPRRVLTSSNSTTSNNKRKERDDPFERPKPIHGPNSKLLKPDKPISKLSGSEPVQSATTTTTTTTTTPSNQLLAGYLAHEFLTKGTLFGQPWIPSRGKEEEEDEDDVGGGAEGEATEAPPSRRPETKIDKERYVEVTALLKGGGTHLPGIVNPTQLARFLDF
ncbi:uncharacterized protein LOC123918468 [Trifolium pratense]|uniref:uncharacterized protein LOC123918468 n=1 Tax=Trifolium pratense TaxID=57577 RepID=UPI001E690F66|nr:uncharacterized protein LOC123918468 [Trifolium pratense]